MEIEGYSNYLIYPDGRIWSKYKKNYLNTFLRTDGYSVFTISKGKRERKTFLQHRLVALHYIPNPNNFPEVNHINCKRSDNRVENLEWCDKFYNMCPLNTSRDIGGIQKTKNNTYRYRFQYENKRYAWTFQTEEEAECQRILMTSMLEG